MRLPVTCRTPYMVSPPHGTKEVTNIAKNGTKALLLTLLLAVSTVALYVGYGAFYRAAYPLKYTEQVERSGEATGLPTELLYAVIRTESGFKPEAKSSVGACGLMQITPDTLNWVRYRMGESGGADPDLLFRPEENIHYGAQTLALLLDEFGALDTALAAYHAGWGNVTRWLDDSRYSTDGESLSSIPFNDTDSYVTKVLSTAEMYKSVYGL